MCLVYVPCVLYMCLTSAQREKIVSIVSLPCVSAGQKDTPDGSAAEIDTRDGGVEEDGNQSCVYCDRAHVGGQMRLF